MSTHAARLIAPDGCGGRPRAAPDPRSTDVRADDPRGPARGAPPRDGTRTGGPAYGGPSPNGSSANGPALDGKRFRSVLGHFATGVVAITAIDPDTGRPCGLAANSFTSVSLDPPLVAFCVAHTSTSWPRLRAAPSQCVNVLAEHQQGVCTRLATRGGDKFAGLGWSASPAGNPVIDGALAWIDCSIEAEHLAGDHLIVVARVHQLDAHGDGGPLVFYRGGYGRFQA
jgi:3-hydroxy-9,10-secoandrosta-1,3,5(10)-triene-9,17-dione monooxygenase reductase component